MDQEPSCLPPSLSDGIGLSVYPRYVSIITTKLLNLTISTATSVDVERVFSKGRILLSHVRNGLTVQSTRALLCLGAWSKLGLVEDEDVALVAKLADVDGCEADLVNDWDDIL